MGAISERKPELTAIKEASHDNTIGFFAPDPRYAADVPNSLREFKEMVARFHDAGLEVILDVVYNHTAEGNERGPTLS